VKKGLQYRTVSFYCKKGAALVVFVLYRTVDISVDHRYQTLGKALYKSCNRLSQHHRYQKVGFMGHSFGGGASIDLAYKAFEKGWGQNARFFFMAPGILLTGTAR
jgi:acetyl esterase/lipase